ncbi:hypothetical protein ACFUMH_10865 [Cellulomonas sp. NPDC057328]|uniref:hypothetical protein n=1 Tax=Cellulomonas sp. NPDC057328 TaxID=3346101 RepID=UPI00362E182B
MTERPTPTPLQRALWTRRAEAARSDLRERFAGAGAALDARWCDHDASRRHDARATALGSSPHRRIQRRPDRASLIAAVRGGASGLQQPAELLVRLHDAPDAGWALVRPAHVVEAVLPAMRTWTSDGLLLLHPDVPAVVSLDVDGTAVESTVTGEAFAPFLGHLLRVGPEPLRLVEHVQRRRR